MKLVASLSLFEHSNARYQTLFGCLALSFCFLLVLRPYLENSVGTVYMKLWTDRGGPSMPMIGNKDSSQELVYMKVWNGSGGPSMPMNGNKDSSQELVHSKLWMGNGGTSSMPMIGNKDSSQELAAKSEKRIFPRTITCDFEKLRYDFCEMNGDIRIHANLSEILLVSSSQMDHYLENATWKIRPYTTKDRPSLMSTVRELSLKSLTGQEQAPNCSIYHSVPALVFSTAGYIGNYFHDFAEVLVPLFITSRQYHGNIQFLITNCKTWWVDKYHVILKHLSKYEIINFDDDHKVHCFSNVSIGLKFHKELGIDPSKDPNGYSMLDFMKFLRSSYSLPRDFAITIGDDGGKKPRLMIVTRNKTRTITNVGGVVEMARSLGYEVVIPDLDFGVSLSKISQIVNSCDVMMGVHGAGLTNVVFLPTNAVLIQVLPFGETEWLARNCFGDPSVDMKIRYLEYKIEENESTLTEQYPHDHPVLRDPVSIAKQGWDAFWSIYLDKQSVKLDVGRFKDTLLKALELLHN